MPLATTVIPHAHSPFSSWLSSAFISLRYQFKWSRTFIWLHLMRFFDCYRSAQFLKFYQMKFKTKNTTVRHSLRPPPATHRLTCAAFANLNRAIERKFPTKCALTHSWLHSIAATEVERAGVAGFERDFGGAAGRGGMLWEDWWGHRAPNALPFKYGAAH